MKQQDHHPVKRLEGRRPRSESVPHGRGRKEEAMDNRNVAGLRAVRFKLTSQWIVVGPDGQTVARTLCYASAELALQAGIQARRPKLAAAAVPLAPVEAPAQASALVFTPEENTTVLQEEQSELFEEVSA
jgi:hypothetical protein